MADISFANLDATFGAASRAKGGYVMKQAFIQSVTPKHITTINGIKDILELAVPYVADLTQKGGANGYDGFNPTTNAIGFEAVELRVRPAKIDIRIQPTKYSAKWIAYKQSIGSDPTDMSAFEPWLLDLMVKRAVADTERIIWRGTYNAAVVAAGSTDTLSVADGFLKKIDDAITATELTPVVTGVISVTNAVASLDAVWAALSDELKQPGAKMYVSRTIYEYYTKNFWTLNQSTPFNSGFVGGYAGPDQTGRTNPEPPRLFLGSSFGYCEIVPVPALAGSGRVICDPLGVMHVGTDLANDNQIVRMDTELRDIRFIMDWKVGTAIVATNINGVEYLSVNDQA